MSCFEECCRQEPEIETAPCSHSSFAQALSTWPAECPDEAADLVVTGLEDVVCAGGVSGSSLPEIEVEKNDSCPSQSTILKRTRTTDLEILRGITLRDSLRSRGTLWRKNPMYLPQRK